MIETSRQERNSHTPSSASDSQRKGETIRHEKIIQMENAPDQLKSITLKHDMTEDERRKET